PITSPHVRSPHPPCQPCGSPPTTSLLWPFPRLAPSPPPHHSLLRRLPSLPPPRPPQPNPSS
uniref:Uncharacterized protein n=1 Tax=Aegilops tauschii subsp. strangulata TaxID=200361 RepID=A0A453NWP1_AEGTS